MVKHSVTYCCEGAQKEERSSFMPATEMKSARLLGTGTGKKKNKHRGRLEEEKEQRQDTNLVVKIQLMVREDKKQNNTAFSRGSVIDLLQLITMLTTMLSF